MATKVVIVCAHIYYKSVTNFVISGLRLKITIILALHLWVSDLMNEGESSQLGKFGFGSLHNRA